MRHEDHRTSRPFRWKRFKPTDWRVLSYHNTSGLGVIGVSFGTTVKFLRPDSFLEM